MKAKIVLFTDNIKIGMMVVSPAVDCLILQSELNIFDDCRIQCLELSFNVEKCSVVSFIKSSFLLYYDYFLNDTLLQRMAYINDLGFHFTPSLNFDKHINATIGKVLKVLDFILNLILKWLPLLAVFIPSI